MHIKSLILFIGLAFLYAGSSFAQTETVPALPIDSKVSDLVNKHIEYNQNHKAVGFRINIYIASGNNSKSQAWTAKQDFEKLYDTIPTYFVFEEPYFKVKVGNFRTRLEAYNVLNKIKPDYPNAYIIKDEIECSIIFDEKQ